MEGVSTGRVLYRCGRCGRVFDLQQLMILAPRVRCPHCGYRVIYKVRTPVVKKVKAI
ncbi:MAG TPA: DNA-directed RNA polymerase subunit P [Desulfurococcaceae archaeon]|nr:DNA-directed RNA polymerase subunit P [Desulfurococcaceae archaeon]